MSEHDSACDCPSCLGDDDAYTRGQVRALFSKRAELLAWTVIFVLLIIVIYALCGKRS